MCKGLGTRNASMTRIAQENPALRRDINRSVGHMKRISSPSAMRKIRQ